MYLYNIARGVVLPQRFDSKTLNLENVLFARILVDADCSNPLPGRILVKWDKIEFFVGIVHKNLSQYCNGCGTKDIQ